VLELREQAFENTDMEVVHKKLKIMKSVYTELSKIMKLKKNGADTDGLYKPKLALLRGVTVTTCEITLC
jgi:hypothetical protein